MRLCVAVIGGVHRKPYLETGNLLYGHNANGYLDKVVYFIILLYL